MPVGTSTKVQHSLFVPGTRQRVVSEILQVLLDDDVLPPARGDERQRQGARVEQRGTVSVCLQLNLCDWYACEARRR